MDSTDIANPEQAPLLALESNASGRWQRQKTLIISQLLSAACLRACNTLINGRTIFETLKFVIIVAAEFIVSFGVNDDPFRELC
jgi:hypothetical protein